MTVWIGNISRNPKSMIYNPRTSMCFYNHIIISQVYASLANVVVFTMNKVKNY